MLIAKYFKGLFKMSDPFFTKLREFAKLKATKSWYKAFCSLWDEGGARPAFTYLKSLNVYDKLLSMSEAFAKKETGRKLNLNRHEMFAFRHPTLNNECQICGEPVKFKSDTQTWAENCSRECMNSSQSVANKRKSTCLNKYGVDNPSKVEEFKDKRTETIQEKFGVDNAFQSKDLMEKAKETIIRKYGVDNIGKSKEAQQKAKSTSLNRYGAEHWTQAPGMRHKIYAFTPEMLAKSRRTVLTRYGEESPFQVPEIQAKCRATYIERYANNPDAMELFGFKSCTDIFGKEHVVQGYEPQAIEHIGTFKNLIRIVTLTKKIPTIKYKLSDKPHTYYPDLMYFTTRNTYLIEVKSDWTLSVKPNKRAAKFAAATDYCKKKGWKFLLYVFDKDMVLHKIKFPTKLEDFQHLAK